MTDKHRVSVLLLSFALTALADKLSLTNRDPILCD